MCQLPNTRCNHAQSAAAIHSSRGCGQASGGLKKSEEERRWLKRTRFEFRMELAPDVIRMLRNLEDFHALTRGVATNKFETGSLQLLHVLRVHLIPVPVTLIEGRCTVVQLGSSALWRFQHRSARPKAHGTTHLRARPFGHENDQGRGAILLEFRRVCRLDTKHIACILDDGELKAEANSQVWLIVLTGIPGSGDLAIDGTDAEAARHEDTVRRRERCPCCIVCCAVGSLGGLIEVRRVDPPDSELALDRERGMKEGLVHGKVGVGEVGVLANDGNRDLNAQRVDQLSQRGPLSNEVLLVRADARRNVEA
mmetsp:Transcript_22356/g.68063  ORF Transcript_22356/g.68063 Transcript_22356/m.68063 type:complete len:310 (-) Transcript_22356:1249-2178(-)